MRTMSGMAAIAAAGAGLAAGAPASVAAPAAEVVTAGDAGTTVRLVPGQALRIELEECGPCGYRWVRRRDATAPAVLRYRSRSYRDPVCDSEPCPVGGPGVRVFRYRARQTGSTRVRLAYLPPGSSEPAESFRIRVLVRR